MSDFTNVRESMKIAQPDFVRNSPSRPEVGGLGLSILRANADACKHGAAALKEEGAKEGAPVAHRGTLLAAQLMLEELGETLQAMSAGDLVGMADGLADLKYVTNWAAHAHGVDLDAVFAEVHRANMRKFQHCLVCAGESIEEAAVACFGDLYTGETDRTVKSKLRSLAKRIRVAAMETSGTAEAVHAFLTGVEDPPGLRPYEKITLQEVRKLLDLYLANRVNHYTDEIRFGRADCTCRGTGRTVIRDASGKYLKPEGWTPPDVAGVLARQVENTQFETEHLYHAAAAKAFTSKPFRVVAAVIQDSEGRRLVGRRAKGHYAGHWEFPGGKVEGSETDIAALTRELIEEGIVLGGEDVQIGDFEHAAKLTMPDGRRFSIRHYSARAFGVQAAPPPDGSHTEFAWVTDEDVQKLHPVTPGLESWVNAMFPGRKTGGQS